MAGPLITLTTAFGLADPSVAACKGAILGIAAQGLGLAVDRRLRIWHR